MDIDLSGRVALVTGGGSGIGRAIAEALAASGSAVAVVGRTAERLESTAAAICKTGARAATIVADVSDAESVRAMARQAEASLGSVDILVHAAGVYSAYPLLRFPEREWQETIATNLTGAFLCAKALVPGMAARRWGRVINIASPSAFTGFARMSAYAASKGGLVAFTRCIAAELGSFGVTANCVCPGVTATERFATVFGETNLAAFAGAVPLGRVARPADCAGAVLFLASDAGQYVTGATIVVDGGMLAVFPTATGGKARFERDGRNRGSAAPSGPPGHREPGPS